VAFDNRTLTIENTNSWNNSFADLTYITGSRLRHLLGIGLKGVTPRPSSAKGIVPRICNKGQLQVKNSKTQLRKFENKAEHGNM
jgi:hypothetical protein